jgi:hypothetical protein
MNTNRDTSFRQSFVLTEPELRKLHQALEEFGGDIKIEIKCRDGLNRNLTSLEELLDFENPPNKEIQTLILTSRSIDYNRSNYNRSARLRFMNADDSNIWVSIEGPEEAVVKLNSQSKKGCQV